MNLSDLCHSRVTNTKVTPYTVKYESIKSRVLYRFPGDLTPSPPPPSPHRRLQKLKSDVRSITRYVICIIEKFIHFVYFIRSSKDNTGIVALSIVFF